MVSPKFNSVSNSLNSAKCLFGVTQVKTVEKDGYAAVQLGFQDKKEKHTTKPLMGHFKKAGVTPKRHLAEFKEFENELNLFT